MEKTKKYLKFYCDSERLGANYLMTWRVNNMNHAIKSLENWTKKVNKIRSAYYVEKKNDKVIKNIKL